MSQRELHWYRKLRNTWLCIVRFFRRLLYLIGLLKPAMNRDTVAKIWVHRALCDLYFGFDIDYDPFEKYERFAEFMGMEKFLKAALLFTRHKEYEFLSNSEAKIKINKIASSYGHEFDRMISELTKIGLTDFDRIKNSDYDGYQGDELIEACKDGYFETRYPVPKSASDKFPIGNTGFTHDPLSSSGITKFVYAVCNACYYFLSKQVDFTDQQISLADQFSGRESFRRFNNLFWEPRCRAD